jgi:hypothetical protein
MNLLFQYSPLPQLLPLLAQPPSRFYQDYFFDFYSPKTIIEPVRFSGAKAYKLEAVNEVLVSDYMGMDVSSKLPDLQFKNFELKKKLSVSMELNFGKWLSNQEMSEKSGGAITSVNSSINLFSLFTKDNTLVFRLSLERKETGNGTRSAFQLKTSVFSPLTKTESFEIPQHIINKMHSSIESSTTQSLGVNNTSLPTELAQNLKITLYLQVLPNGNLNTHIFLFQPSTSLSAESLITHHATLPNQKALTNPVTLSFLSPTSSSQNIPSISKLQLTRIVLSDSIQGILSNKIISSSSVSLTKCRSQCLSPLGSASSSKSCLQCPSDMVYDYASGKCQHFCMYQTKNINGNCLKCRFNNCSDVSGDITLKLSNKDDYKIISAPNGILEYTPNYYEKHFDLFLIRDGLPHTPIPFTTQALNTGNHSARIVPNMSSIKNLNLAAKNSGYRLVAKPGVNVISNSRNLYHQRSALITDNLGSNYLNSVQPIYSNFKRKANDDRRVMISDLSPGITGFNKNITIDTAFKKCKFNDKTMRNLALALFIMICIMNVIYIIYSLFFWNKTLVFQLPSLTTVICIHMNCLYQAMIFCLFYEKNLPPAVTSFLRHSYYYAIHWHGAFRSVAIKDLGANKSFFADYNNTLIPRRLSVAMVQNIFINFGVIFLIWAVVWIIAAVLLFLFRKPEVMYKDNFTQYIKWKYNSFLNRIAISFALKLAFWVWIIFCVEFSFFFTYDLLIAVLDHPFFNASFGFSILFLILHFLAILFLLYLPFLLSEFVGRVLKPSNSNSTPQNTDFPMPDPNVNKYSKSIQIYPKPGNQQWTPGPDANITSLERNIKNTAQGVKDTINNTAQGVKNAVNGLNPVAKLQNRDIRSPYKLDKNSIHYTHNTYITSKSYWKYNHLYALQGLRRNFFGLHHWGVTALIFTIYGIVISSMYKHPKPAIIINLVLILVMFVYIFMSQPGFAVLPRLLLLAAYLFFFIAKFILLFYIFDVIQKGTGRSVCDCALAIVALFFIAMCFLILAFLASIFYSCLLNKVFPDYFVELPVEVNNVLPVNEALFLMPDDDRTIIEVNQNVDVESPVRMIERYKEGK